MCSNNLLCRQLGFPLQGVNILSEAAKEQSFLVQQGHEIVCRCGLVFAWE